MAATIPPRSSICSSSCVASSSRSRVKASTVYEPPRGSITSAAPCSKASSCWVRSAVRAASSVGSASASSIPLACNDWQPPSTAASAWIATRTTLLRGCWAVSDDPAVWAWNRIRHDLGSVAPNRSFMMRAQSRRAALNLATSSRRWLWALKKNERRGANSSTPSPAETPASV